MRLVRQAFDRHAAVYDQTFSNRQIRSDVWEIADRRCSPGMRVLDLGCGTGEDACHFADRGLDVTAIDISPRMITEVRRKAGSAVHCETADMQAYNPQGVRFEAVFSNFGALNCIADLAWLSQLPLAVGAHLVLTTMGRFYPLEFGVSILKGRPRLALRRFGGSCEAVVEGIRFTVYYHSLRSIRKALGPKFELEEVKGLRSLLPAPGLEHLERHMEGPLWVGLDSWLCSHRRTATWADHFVSVWRYREA
jgi:SAM-dependent methyltransferase